MYGANRTSLRGFNFTNDGAAYLDAKYDQREAIARGKLFRNLITEDESDYARVEEWGGNVVRFGLDWHWYRADRENFFLFADQHVAWAKKHRLWLIPVMFVPPGGYQDYGEGTAFWKGAQAKTYQRALKDFWVDFAKHYAAEPAIAGYDLLNEPSAGAVGVSWFSYASSLRDAVHEVDQNHFIVIESHDDAQFWERLPLGRAVKYDNVVYSVHGYFPEAMTHNGVFGAAVNLRYPGNAPDYDGVVRYWDRASTDQLMRKGGRLPIDWARDGKVPLFMGEWGSVKRTTGYLVYLRDQISLMTEWGMHWTLFAYREYDLTTDFGVFNGPSGMTRDLPPDSGMVLLLKEAMSGLVHPDRASPAG